MLDWAEADMAKTCRWLGIMRARIDRVIALDLDVNPPWLGDAREHIVRAEVAIGEWRRRTELLAEVENGA